MFTGRLNDRVELPSSECTWRCISFLKETTENHVADYKGWWWCKVNCFRLHVVGLGETEVESEPRKKNRILTNRRQHHASVHPGWGVIAIAGGWQFPQTLSQGLERHHERMPMKVKEQTIWRGMNLSRLPICDREGYCPYRSVYIELCEYTLNGFFNHWNN